MKKKNNIENEVAWVAMQDMEPPDVVKYYITKDINGNIRELEWYEGAGFRWCSGGYWKCESNEEITNITHWMELEPPEN